MMRFLLDIAEGLMPLFENKTEKFLVETYENDLEFTFKKHDNWLTIECFNEYDSSNGNILSCIFKDFLRAYTQEYLHYTNNILAFDSVAYDNENFKQMREQINILNNLINQIV